MVWRGYVMKTCMGKQDIKGGRTCEILLGVGGWNWARVTVQIVHQWLCELLDFIA